MARRLHIDSPRGIRAMVQINLAAAILRCASSRQSAELPEQDEHLTGEQALGLADWLGGQSSTSAWRLIQLMEINDCLFAREGSG